MLMRDTDGVRGVPPSLPHPDPSLSKRLSFIGNKHMPSCPPFSLPGPLVPYPPPCSGLSFPRLDIANDWFKQIPYPASLPPPPPPPPQQLLPPSLNSGFCMSSQTMGRSEAEAITVWENAFMLLRNYLPGMLQPLPTPTPLISPAPLHPVQSEKDELVEKTNKKRKRPAFGIEHLISGKRNPAQLLVNLPVGCYCFGFRYDSYRTFRRGYAQFLLVIVLVI